MKPVNLLFSILAAILISSCGCSNSSQNSKQQNNFWEGSVKPGTYNISWRENSAYGDNANKVSLEIVIFDNQEFEVRRKTECGLERIYHSSITTMSGYVHKHHEDYNGEEKIWYTLSGTDSDNYSLCYAITPSGSFYRYGGNHWKYLSRDNIVGTIY